jgi:hypothetical protein
VEALARVLASEVGRGAADERVALGWVAVNAARLRGVSVARLYSLPCGPRDASRPFSTRLPADPAGRELAAIILASPPGEDPTRGATMAFEPAAQDRMARLLRGKVPDARAVRRRWLRSVDYYGTVGRWDLFGPKGGQGAKPVPRAWGIDLADVPRAVGLDANELE